MSVTPSLGNMIKEIGALKKVTKWEADFINRMVRWTNNGGATCPLTDEQIRCIKKIYDKYYAS